MSYEGGYIVHRSDLVRQSSANKHTAALDRPISDADLSALNHVQATPWRINRYIYETLLEAHTKSLPLPGIVETFTNTVPPFVEKEVWASMSAEDRRRVSSERREALDRNAAAEGHLVALLDILNGCHTLVEQPAIYYPHSRCFRGRIHPIPMAGVHPQGSDVNKACLMFANGLPLGPDGMFWLCVRAANCAGMNKRSFADRVQWVIDHREDIVASAERPFECRWWTAADEPWSFLATCHELAQAWATGDDYAEGFVSHLPINLDGTCNGLQHLSAMGLDPVGAAATNLIPSEAPQDIYQIVADEVGRRLMADWSSYENVNTAGWAPGDVTRSTVKRAVMTTPYGVTMGGIRKQLMSDGHLPPGLDRKGRAAAASYMATKIVESLGNTVQAANGIMSWLQGSARALAESGHPFRWTTPTGSVVQQAYKAVKLKRISTLAGTLTLAEDVPGAEFDPRKQALGASPNFIHSFDAAHLSMTVNACHDAGMRSFGMIHDSYAVHAANATELGLILRQQFIRIYQGRDWLRDTADYLRAYAPGVRFDECPKQGTFDLEQVLDSPYFFS